MRNREGAEEQSAREQHEQREQRERREIAHALGMSWCPLHGWMPASHRCPTCDGEVTNE